MPWTVRDDGKPIYTKEPGDDFRDVEAGLVALIIERDDLVEQLRVAHGVGTLAAAERDEWQRQCGFATIALAAHAERAYEARAERDALRAERDALQALVNDLAAEAAPLVRSQIYMTDDLFRRLDAAAKEDQ